MRFVPSFRAHRDISPVADASRGRDDQTRVVRHLEVDVHAQHLEEAVDVRVVERLDAQHIGSRRQAQDLKLSIRAERAAIARLQKLSKGVRLGNIRSRDLIEEGRKS